MLLLLRAFSLPSSLFLLSCGTATLPLQPAAWRDGEARRPRPVVLTAGLRQEGEPWGVKAGRVVLALSDDSGMAGPCSLFSCRASGRAMRTQRSGPRHDTLAAALARPSLGLLVHAAGHGRYVEESMKCRRKGHRSTDIDDTFGSYGVVTLSYRDSRSSPHDLLLLRSLHLAFMPPLLRCCSGSAAPAHASSLGDHVLPADD